MALSTAAASMATVAAARLQTAVVAGSARNMRSTTTLRSKQISVRAMIEPQMEKVASSVDSLLSDASSQKAAAATMAASIFAHLASAPSAAAAQELLTVAEGDSRGFALLLVLLPALGWVAFNILRPALNQLDKMTSAKAAVGAAGIGAVAAAAGLLSAPSAEAAELVAQVAEDNRPLILLLVLGPAVGWVLFNILRPALNQLDKMQGKKGLIGAIGLGAAASGAGLLSPEYASAAQQIAEVAEDNRPLILLLVLGPAIGWVLFNILKPALNQLNKMTGTKAIIGAAGLSALMTSYAGSAEAVQEIATIADDTRPLILLLVLGPAVGWVLFNILKPALRQLDNMQK